MMQTRSSQHSYKSGVKSHGDASDGGSGKPATRGGCVNGAGGREINHGGGQVVPRGSGTSLLHLLFSLFISFFLAR